MIIINQTKKKVLSENTIVAESLLERMKGLLDKKEFNKGQALLLKPCNSIHTLFMNFPIDVVFLDRKNMVIKTICCLNPWRLSGVYLSAELCIELPAGTIESTSTSLGDILSFVES